mgnify:CR=1 FL=1
MELRLLSKEENKVKIEVIGESHTLLNLLRENAWKTGAKQVSYMIKHPYLSNPEIIIKSGQYKKVLSDAATLIEDEAKAFGREFQRLTKK